MFDVYWYDSLETYGALRYLIGKKEQSSTHCGRIGIWPALTL